MSKKTLIIGASLNPERYSFKAIQMLREYGHEVIALGKHPGRVGDVQITTTPAFWKNIDTVTLYINSDIQKEYSEYIPKLAPKRVIYNPGTENEAFEEYIKKQYIEVVRACTLVLLRTGQY